MLARRVPISGLTRRCYNIPTTACSAVYSSSFRFASNNKRETEDAEEIAKEQRLREMFNKNNSTGAAAGGGFFSQIKQVHQQALKFAEMKTAEAVEKRKLQQGGGGNSSDNNNNSSNDSSSSNNNNTSGDQQQQKPQVPSWFGPSQTFWTMMIYLTASYSTFLVWQLSDDQSFVSLTQGVPHWANGAYEESAYMLFRIIYSYRDQRRIQQEFESFAPMAPNTSFLDFLNQRYAAALSGNTCSFPECIALMSSALRQDFGRNTAVIAQAAKGREVRDKIDGIANALRSAGVRPMYSTSSSSSSTGNNYNPNVSPYSAPIPPQLLQQAQGMHAAGFTGYGNPQMLQAWQRQVYNPYYANQQQQQQQNPVVVNLGSTPTPVAVTEEINNNTSSSPVVSENKQ